MAFMVALLSVSLIAVAQLLITVRVKAHPRKAVIGRKPKSFFQD